MRHRVFVSHVNDDPETDELLDALCPGLEQAGMDVLLDRACLAPGTLWRQEIYAWLGLCHAAVVVIAPRARRPR
jgi:TIR domain-containing protein